MASSSNNQSPQISVIMPVYNAAPYLTKAITSILSQTFTDFEFIIINDCSTDDSELLIHSFNDPRINYIKLVENKGVVGASNFGLQQAVAPYSCIMHADDIAESNRLEKQKKWLDTYPLTAAVFTFITFINEQDDDTGEWKEDRKTDTAQKIKQTMPRLNCVAHPTCMIRSNIYKKYGYYKNQQSQEDYDLWLRMLADGLIIEKIPEALLWYRVHDASITGTILRKSNPFFKQLDCKTKFLKHRIKEGKWGLFETQVMAGAAFDLAMGVGKVVKRKIVK